MSESDIYIDYFLIWRRLRDVRERWMKKDRQGDRWRSRAIYILIISLYGRHGVRWRSRAIMHMARIRTLRIN